MLVSRGVGQPLVHGASDVRGRAGLVQAGLATPHQERSTGAAAGIPSDKNHALPQGGVALPPRIKAIELVVPVIGRSYSPAFLGWFSAMLDSFPWKGVRTTA